MPEHFKQPRAAQRSAFTELHMSSADTLSLADPHILEQVQRYANWLAKQAESEKRRSSEEVKNYIREATTLVKVGDHEIAPFAPFRPELSALRTFTTPQVLICCALAVLWLVAVLIFQLQALTVVISVITAIYTVFLLLNLLIALKSLQSTSEMKIDDEIVHLLKHAKWPKYTVLCPLYREAQVVPQFVEAMQALDYPPEKLQILFLTEENDSETRAAIRALSLPSNFQILMVPDGVPRTKPRACNYGLLNAVGTYTVIYDAEDIPDPLQLKKAVLAFANSDLQTVCVQAKLNFYNSTQNLLTRWFTAEYSTWFDFVLPGLQATNFALPLGGTSNHFRTASLRALGGWDAYNVTEDCDLGLRLKRFQMKTVILDSTTLEEANSQLKNWLRQRSRWIKGYMQTYLVHMRTPFKTIRESNLYNFFSFQFVIGSRTGMLFFNLLMWLLLAFYLILREKATPVYHILFPAPTLYLGAFCLIFGNFFYMYLHLLVCQKRGDYHLVFWSLFIPIYWLLMSIAGIYAFIELLVKPHYWQKTVHGLHFKGGRRKQTAQEAAAFVRQQTQSLSPIRAVPRKNSPEVLRTITSMLKGIDTLPLPVMLTQQKQAGQSAKKAKSRDPWFIAVIILSCITSIVSTWYVVQNHLNLIYSDANAHLLIARRLYDNVSPGLAQLGGIWLPLPHLLIGLFAWNDYLWTTGLAGSIVGMGCYVGTAIYVFLTIRRLVKDSCSGFIGALVFILNPNVLYLQATPLTEPLCWITFTASCYYLLAWIQEDKQKYLILAAASTFFATLARYDGWSIFFAFLVVIPVVGFLKHYSLRKIESSLVSYSVLAGLGIALWFAWNKIIFGDFLNFQHGAYSSQAQAQSEDVVTLLRHHVLTDIQYFSIVSVETLGIVLSAIVVVAIIRLLIMRWKVIDKLATIIFLLPFAFYVVALYLGQVTLLDSHVTFYPSGIIPASESPHLFNSRFGSEIVAPAAILIGLLVPTTTKWRTIFSKWGKWAIRSCLLLLIVFQFAWILHGGVISIISNDYPPDCVTNYPISVYLNEHYNGGKILQTNYPFHLSESNSGVHFSNVIYEGSKGLWDQALQHPETTVSWVILQPGDIVDQSLAHYDPAFAKQFRLVVKAPYGLRLYQRNGLPPLPTRQLSSYLQSEQQICTLSGP
ncbi:MAG TPA: glycosyltransferase [Ktedonobacteraceae bacterium]|nr:glycosyltransferase [Ktedonobacteraceae bacterium]